MDKLQSTLMAIVGATEAELEPTSPESAAVMMYAAMEAKVAQYEAALTEIEEAVGA